MRVPSRQEPRSLDRNIKNRVWTLHSLPCPVQKNSPLERKKDQILKNSTCTSKISRLQYLKKRKKRKKNPEINRCGMGLSKILFDCVGGWVASWRDLQEEISWKRKNIEAPHFICGGQPQSQLDLFKASGPAEKKRTWPIKGSPIYWAAKKRHLLRPIVGLRPVDAESNCCHEYLKKRG